MTTRRTNRGLPTIAVDFLFLALLAFVMLINPPAKDADDTPQPGTLSVAIAWLEGPVDVDLWVQGPDNGRPVGYSHRSGRVFSLLRDDTGTAGDVIPLNFENAYGRATPAGEYIVNLHCFSCPGETPVSIEVRKGGRGDNVELLFQEVMHLQPREELTAVRFRLDRNGSVIPGSVSQIFQPLRSAPQ